MNRVPVFSEHVDSSSVNKSSRKSLESETIIFKPEDNFCGINGSNSIKVKGAWTTEYTVKFDHGAEIYIQDFVESISDKKLFTRIRGFDLCVWEVQYHMSCQMKYLQNPKKWRSQDKDQDTRTIH